MARLAAILCLLALPARAMSEEDAQQWIHENYPVCCEHDSCVSVRSDAVTFDGRWYTVDWRGYAVRFHKADAKPSPNENYMVCQEDFDPVPRCFFRPVLGS